MQLYHFHDQSYHHPQLLPEMYETFRLNNFELLRTSSSGAPCGSTSCAWPARSGRRGGGRGKCFHLFQTFISSPKSVQIEVNYFAISGDRTTALPWSQLGQLLGKKKYLQWKLLINISNDCDVKTVIKQLQLHLKKKAETLRYLIMKQISFGFCICILSSAVL